ncbi:GIY-YIG nuclease family protein [Agrobacterium rhizogenes]|nr:GIY-YIG nuclease family protein [Rhizobium rhizogenes]
MKIKHFVYIIARRTESGLVGPVKVGVTRTLGSRLAGIQTGCWDRLEIAYHFEMVGRDAAYNIERLFHQRLAGNRMQGEWFSVEPIEALEALCDVVFTFIDAHTPKRDRQVALIESGAIDNLKIVVDTWGLAS